MAIIITDECINCGACEPECPNHAIYEGGAEWKYSDGTGLRGIINPLNQTVEVDADGNNTPVSMDVEEITCYSSFLLRRIFLRSMESYEIGQSYHRKKFRDAIGG